MKKVALMIVAIVFSSLVVSGCQKQEPEGELERLGKSLDQTTQRFKQAAEETAREYERQYGRHSED